MVKEAELKTEEKVGGRGNGTNVGQSDGKK